MTTPETLTTSISPLPGARSIASLHRSRDLLEQVDQLMALPRNRSVDATTVAQLQLDLAGQAEEAQRRAALVDPGSRRAPAESAYWGYQAARAQWAYSSVARRFGPAAPAPATA
jgi:hypothetical protein